MTDGKSRLSGTIIDFISTLLNGNGKISKTCFYSESFVSLQNQGLRMKTRQNKGPFIIIINEETLVIICVINLGLKMTNGRGKEHFYHAEVTLFSWYEVRLCIIKKNGREKFETIWLLFAFTAGRGKTRWIWFYDNFDIVSNKNNPSMDFIRLCLTWTYLPHNF